MFRLLLLLLFTSPLLQAQKQSLKLNGLFRDNMVLQQQSEATIWGRSEPGQTIKITSSWNRKSTQSKADAHGKWKSILQTPKAGGPHSIKVTSKNDSITLKNVLIGEVWICGGQSNMQWRMRGFGPKHWADEVAEAKFPDIRYCYLPQVMSLTPQDDLKCTWSICSPKTVLSFGAVPYFFGEKLHQELDVPIGLIATNWGGSTAEAWVNPDVLGKKFPEFKSTLSKNATHQDKLPATFPKGKDLPKGLNQMSPALLYNSMIHPLIPFKIKGAIWYQGESNVKAPEQYRSLFPSLIQNWRAEWKQGDFPFYFVQIAPFHYKSNPMSAAFLREAQTMTLSEPNTGMVVTMDLGDPTNIHPKRKKPVAHRLANLALANDYGHKNIQANSPLLKDHKISGNKIHLTFHHAENGLTTSDEKNPSHFTIAGRDKKFHPAIAIIQGSQIIVSSPKVQSPLAVRHAWASDAEPNLTNKSNLPAPSFRTDTWPIK